jgi:hypothetical protein
MSVWLIFFRLATHAASFVLSEFRKLSYEFLDDLKSIFFIDLVRMHPNFLKELLLVTVLKTLFKLIERRKSVTDVKNVTAH